MRLSEDVDLSTINWTGQAYLAHRDAEALPTGARRNAEIDLALACEVLVQSRNLLLQPGRLR
jgi:hypothetical protein